jgi:hypothetical protein
MQWVRFDNKDGAVWCAARRAALSHHVIVGRHPGREQPKPELTAVKLDSVTLLAPVERPGKIAPSAKITGARARNQSRAS